MASSVAIMLVSAWALTRTLPTTHAFCRQGLRNAFASQRHLALAPAGTPSTSFDDGKRPFYITTPIYYVNDKPHIGHAYTSVACDVIARFMRLSGRTVFFLSGTDEHGQKVEQAAAARGVRPQDLVDDVSGNFSDLLTLLNVSNDQFIRTTQSFHKTSVQQLWRRLVEKDYIYLGTYEGWYAVRDECFYSESELIDGKAPTGAEVEWLTEKSYFFKLSLFQEPLLKYYEDHPDFIAPESRRNEVMAFVNSGLRDLSISRTSFTWGVPVPDDPDHVMYVWIDALANYVSALGYPEDGDNRLNTFWPAALHVVGKDILRFHAVYWPAMLMAAGLECPKRLFAHGWWTKEGQKISKSIGNVIDPVELVETYGVDATRFFLMADVIFGNDGDFSDREMIYRCNANLANELGNLCQRTLSLVFKNCDRQVPQHGEFTDEDDRLLGEARSLRQRCGEAVSVQAVNKYVQEVITLVWNANKYIDTMAPWALKKTDPDRMGTVLYVILEVLRHVAIMYQPVMPVSANKILDQLAIPESERTFQHLDKEFEIAPGLSISKPVGVFPRMEVPAGELVES